MYEFQALVEALELTDIERDYFTSLINGRVDVEEYSRVRDEWAIKNVPYRTQDHLRNVAKMYNFSKSNRRMPKGRKFSLDFFIEDQNLQLEGIKKKIALERENWRQTTSNKN